MTEHEKANSRQRFEHDSIQGNCSDALSEEGLYYRNIRFIQDQAYRKVMTRFGAVSWCLHGEKKLDRSSRCVVSLEDPMDTKLVAPAVCDTTASSRTLPLPLITATSLFRSSVSFLLSDVSKKPRIVYGYVAN